MPDERRKGGRPRTASATASEEAARAAQVCEAAAKPPVSAGVAGYDIRVRIRDGETPVFGPGRLALLRAIDATGSISAAARQMGMSYRRAWLLVESMNHEFREPVVLRHIGGASGGGATLTPFGLNLTAHYDMLIQEIHTLLDAHVSTFDAYLKDGTFVDPDDEGAASAE